MLKRQRVQQISADIYCRLMEIQSFYLNYHNNLGESINEFELVIFCIIAGFIHGYQPISLLVIEQCYQASTALQELGCETTIAGANKVEVRMLQVGGRDEFLKLNWRPSVSYTKIVQRDITLEMLGILIDWFVEDAKYAQIWEYLRDEFELTRRFATLDFKLKFVEHNIWFLQETLQNRKSAFLSG